MRAQYCHIHAAYFSSHLVVPSPRFPLLRDYNRFQTHRRAAWSVCVIFIQRFLKQVSSQTRSIFSACFRRPGWAIAGVIARVFNSWKRSTNASNAKANLLWKAAAGYFLTIISDVKCLHMHFRWGACSDLLIWLFFLAWAPALDRFLSVWFFQIAFHASYAE